MTNTARMCQTASCKREAATLCYHCQQEVCHTHFIQHSSMIMADVYSLADRINILTDDITAFSIAQTRDSLFNQLKQWRNESIKLIENIYTQKKFELNEKISQLDTVLNLAKIEKQQEISQIKEKITELIDAGEATFDQMNRLRKSVDQIVLDIDKLQLSTIRIETQPGNLDTCRISYIDRVPDTQSDDVRHFNKPADQFHSSTSQSMVTIENSGSESSSPMRDSLTTSYPPYVPLPMSSPLPSPPPLPSLPVPPRMADPRSSIYKPPQSIYQQRPSFTPPSQFIYEPSSHTFRLPYPPLESSFPRLWSPDFSYMNQLPVYTGRNSTEYPLGSSPESDD